MNASGNELEILREWTGWFCHKLPERSPHSGGDLFPVCFRCAGLQLGLAAAYLRLWFCDGWRGRFPEVRVAIQCAAMLLPLMIDGLGNALQLWNSPDWWRGLTGLGVGLSLPWLLAPLAQSLDAATDRARKPALENLAQMFWPAVGGGVAIGLLARGGGPVGFRILAAAAAAGWVLFLGHFVLALVRAYGNALTRRLISWITRSELHPDSESTAALPAGGPGHWPVPGGDPPLGTGKVRALFRASVSSVNVLPVPSGQWPDGTGGSPVPPIPTAEFELKP